MKNGKLLICSEYKRCPDKTCDWRWSFNPEHMRSCGMYTDWDLKEGFQFGCKESDRPGRYNFQRLVRYNES